MILLAPLLVPFFALIAAFVLVGLSQTHSSQHGTSFTKTFLDTITGRTYLNQIRSLATQAARVLVSRFGAAQLKMLTAYLHAMAHLWKQEFAAMRAEARATTDVAHAIERAIPREAHKAAAPALARAKVADRHATRALGLEHTTARELHDFRTTTRARLKADAHAIDVTLPRDIAGVRRREEALSRDQAKLRERTTSLENGAIKAWDWIRAHPYALATTAFAGAVAIALDRLGLRFLRCRGWKRLFGRLTCGMGSLLEELFFLSITAFAVTDVCDFANAASRLAEDFSPILLKIVDVENALVGCRGADAPPDLVLPAAHYPPSNLGLRLAD